MNHKPKYEINQKVMALNQQCAGSEDLVFIKYRMPFDNKFNCFYECEFVINYNFPTNLHKSLPLQPGETRWIAENELRELKKEEC
jgi:hypothetical protein